jgi:hypothetical protein
MLMYYYVNVSVGGIGGYTINSPRGRLRAPIAPMLIALIMGCASPVHGGYGGAKSPPIDPLQLILKENSNNTIAFFFLCVPRAKRASDMQLTQHFRVR